MIKSVLHPNIAGFFTNEKILIYEIPKYQRAYTWSKTEWSQLFDDIIDNQPGYFLGSTISVSQDASIYETTSRLELIDGQQRATSLSILTLVFYKKLLPLIDREDDDDFTFINDLKRRLVWKDKNSGQTHPRLILQVQDNNRADYESLLSEAHLLTAPVTPPMHAGNRRIYRAERYFSARIDEYLEHQGETEPNLSQKQLLINLANRFFEAIIVTIEVADHSDAFMLFESLNFRGAKLNAVDLIKNALISASDHDNCAELTYQRWLRIQSDLGENDTTTERFFRQYYNAFRQKLNEPFRTDDPKHKYPLGDKATKSTIMNIYEHLIRHDYQTLLQRLEAASAAYAIITNHPDRPAVPYQQELLNLEHIQGAPSYLLLLYLQLNRERLGLSDADFGRIVHLLTVFFVRRNLTDIPSTRDLDKIFMNIVDELHLHATTDVYGLIRSHLVPVSASDADFKSKLGGPLYLDNADTTRFILCYIEEQNRIETNETEHIDLWKRAGKDNKYVWTIEHIFPEGENIPESWVSMITGTPENPAGDPEQAKLLREQYTHTLGNLTMTGYNSSLSNKSFDDKKTRTDSKGNYVGYLNGLYLNSRLKDEPDWTIPKIEARTARLIAQAMQLFQFS